MKLTSSFLLDIPLSALNSSGLDDGSADNETRVKRFYYNGEYYPYISGQAWRKWWRDTLQNRFGWELSPFYLGGDVRSEGGSKGQYGYTEADPIRYPDDDLFGYMRVDKDSASQGRKAKRISPLRVSNVVSLRAALVSDLVTQSRLAEISSGSAIAFRELYQAVMVGQFTLDLDRVGRFQFSHDPEQSIITELAHSLLYMHLDEPGLRWVKHDMVELAPKVRYQCASQLVSALSVLEGGANLTRGLADIIPRVAIFTFTETGNALLQGVFEYGQPIRLNMEKLAKLQQDGHAKEFYLYINPSFRLGYTELDGLHIHTSWSELLQQLSKELGLTAVEYSVEF